MSLVISNISKTYPNGLKALNHLSLTIPPHELVTIVGPSGCGKSTLLHTIANLTPYDEGFIDYPKDWKIAMVFQDNTLYPHLTIYENIGYALPKENRHQTIMEVVDLLEIHPLIDKKPNELSGGQRQRAAIAKALALKPDLLLMDEPLSHLDLSLKLQLRSIIKALHQKLQMTMLYVTHDQEEALSMGTLVAVMDQGMIIQVDSPKTLYQKPKTLTVARKIGIPPMNIIDQEDYILGLRPEAILLNDSFKETTFQGQLERIDYIGKEQLAYINYKNQILCVQIPTSISLDIGNIYTFCFDPKHCCVYDKKTKRLLTNQQSILKI